MVRVAVFGLIKPGLTPLGQLKKKARHSHRENVERGFKPIEFDLPEVPKVGDHISVEFPHKTGYISELKVENVAWLLHHPMIDSPTKGNTAQKGQVGNFVHVVVNCSLDE